MTSTATPKPATDKREAIVRAALELFVERGFYGVAVPEIAERAQVGAGTIYRYFESKEALVNALYRDEKMRWAEHVNAFVPAASGGTREVFRLLWTRMAEYAKQYEASFIFLELHHHAPYLDEHSRALEHRVQQMFEAIIIAAQARGELKAAPPFLLMGVVLGAFIGVMRSCVEKFGPPTNADWQMAGQCVWEAIRA